MTATAPGVRQEHLEMAVDRLWQTLLGRVPERSTPLGGGSCCAAVPFAGAWRGRLTVCLDLGVAEELAAAWFGAAAADADISDAVREVANTVAGQLKPLLPHPLDLGLPGWCPPPDPDDADLARIAWNDQGRLVQAVLQGAPVRSACAGAPGSGAG
jgi:hypothetical protein